MKKFRQYYLGFLSLLFLLSSNVGLGQTNTNPLDINIRDHYYEAKTTDSYIGDYLIVRKTSSVSGKIVNNSKGQHDFYFNGGFIFGEYGQFGYLNTEDGVINNPGGVINPYISVALNRNVVRWNFLPNEDDTYLLYNVANNNYLRNYVGNNFQYFDFNSNINQTGMKWFIDGVNSIKNVSTNQFLNYKTITGRTWLGIFGSEKSRTEMFSDSTSSNINLYKRLRLDYENHEVPVNTTGIFSRRSETGGLVSYEIIENPQLVSTNINGGNFIINYNQEGVIKVKATVSVPTGVGFTHIPSYTKTFTITILPSHIVTECYKKTITNGIDNSGFSLRSGIQNSNNSTSYIRLNPSSVIESQILSGISGRSVKVELLVASKVSSNNISRVLVSLENSDSNYNRGPIELRFNNSGTYNNINNINNSNLQYRTVEYEFTRVADNSILTIESPPGVIIWFKEVKIKCATSNETIWEGGQWSNGVPTTVDRAVLRENIDTNVNAYSLRIEKNNIEVPTGVSFNIINEINIVEGSSLKFKKGAYLFTGKNAQINRDIEFETSSKYYYWDTRMVSSPVIGQQFAAIYGDNRSSTNNKDYTIFDLILTQNSEYDGIDYIGKWVPYELASFEAGKAYSLQRYRKNNVMLPRFGLSNNPPVEFVESYKGIPNTSDYTVLVQRPGQTNYNGSYAVGNPFTAPISIKQVLIDNPKLEYIELYKNDNSYNFATRSYIDNNDFWIQCNKLTCSDGDYKIIDIGTGFMVTFMDGSISNSDYNLKMNHGAISTQLIDVFQNNNRQEVEESFIKLKLKKGTNTIGNTIVLGKSNLTTNEFDFGYDIKERNDSLGLKSINMNENYTFDVRDNNFNKSFDLFLGTDESSTYEIIVNEISGNYAESEVYLYDKMLNIFHDLKLNNIYSFYSEKGSFEDRFEILFDRNLLINDYSSEDISVYKNLNDYEISSSKLIKSYKVFSIDGKILYEKRNINKNQFKINSIDRGVYLIYFEFIDGNVLTKKILK